MTEGQPTRLADLDDIRMARRRIADGIVATPTFQSVGLGELLGCPVWVKAENLQATGSFKLRGALNAMRALEETGLRVEGYATFSAGNHAAAVAFAARQMGRPAVVCMPPTAVAEKVAAVRRYGGQVVTTTTLLDTCRQVAEERGLHIIHPFDDLAVVAGQGTVGLELIEACGGAAPRDLTVLVPVGGGGLISGVATAVKTLLPHSRVIGFEPATANAVTLSLRAGRPMSLTSPSATLADGLTAPFAGQVTYAHVVERVDEIVVVEEAAITRAVWPCLSSLRMLVEPAAIVPVAGLLSGAFHHDAGRPLAIIASGGNISRDVLLGH